MESLSSADKTANMQFKKLIGLNSEKFQFLIQALHELTSPLIGKNEYRVIIEKTADSSDVRVTYRFVD